MGDQGVGGNLALRPGEGTLSCVIKNQSLYHCNKNERCLNNHSCSFVRFADHRRDLSLCAFHEAAGAPRLSTGPRRCPQCPLVTSFVPSLGHDSSRGHPFLSFHWPASSFSPHSAGYFIARHSSSALTILHETELLALLLEVKLVPSRTLRINEHAPRPTECKWAPTNKPHIVTNPGSSAWV